MYLLPPFLMFISMWSHSNHLHHCLSSTTLRDHSPSSMWPASPGLKYHRVYTNTHSGWTPACSCPQHYSHTETYWRQQTAVRSLWLTAIYCYFQQYKLQSAMLHAWVFDIYLDMAWTCRNRKQLGDIQLQQKINLNKLTDINHHKCWQGHLPCVSGSWILRLTALTKHLPFSLSVSTREVRPTPLVKEETNQGLTISCHLVAEQAITWMSRSQRNLQAACLPLYCGLGPK